MFKLFTAAIVTVLNKINKWYNVLMFLKENSLIYITLISSIKQKPISGEL